MTIIPANKRDSWKVIGQLFTGDAHTSISLGTHRIDDLIVELLYFFMMDINTIGDIPEETDAWICQDFIKDADHRLDGLVIRRNTVANQSERSGEAVEDINGQDDIAFLEKRFGSIKTGWAGTNDSNAEGPGCSSNLFHDISRFQSLLLF